MLKDKVYENPYCTDFNPEGNQMNRIEYLELHFGNNKALVLQQNLE